ncbi:CspA family cold shock protein [Marivibrio halodurans]|uniref:CspA family cold shock protein n=1 Tax=Marivibrio halodurans TaxID=2039722 RepID=A0A8J7UZJ5_9PROT|nr:cold-shock protein [Marivibrio halodurans]MBP5855751.1 CspA family cold shock protein [Marivibrio halodurans]
MNRNLPPAVVHERVSARVKWYNPTKGFGFVKTETGDPDAFMHASVLPQEVTQDLPTGATVTCDLAQGQKGLMVSTVYDVDLSTADPSFGGGGGGAGGGRPPGGGGFGGGGFGGGPRRPPPGPVSDPFEGTVKFFNTAKGFGFIVPDNGGPDVFVSIRTLERCGVPTIDSDQRVRITTRPGDKGPMAESVEVL